jgi:DNA-directed RNA polymerase specialized sigma subunit
MLFKYNREMDDTTKWLLEPDFQAPFQTWQASKREPADNAALIKAINPMIDRHLLRFDEQDRIALRPKAKVLALNAMGKYDPTKANLNTYFSQQLQKLNREYNERQQIIHVPENKNYDRQRIIAKATELESELGRAPTTHELSDKMYMSPRKIERIMSMGNAITHGAFESESEEGGSILPAVHSPVKFDTIVDLIYPDLSTTDKLIFEHSFGLYAKKRLPPAQIAKKLGVSQATVSLRKKYIQEQMDKAVGLLR